MRNSKHLALLTVLCAYGAATYAQDEKKFEVYGFLMTDYIQDFKRVDPAWDSTLRPSKIPTTEGEDGSDGQATISVRQSRFGVKGNLPIDGRSIETKFEFDMFGVGGDEGQTTIRLRHAYGAHGNWLAGQTHSLFMNIDMFPNTIDYWGPAGMVFLRNPQIRYTFMKGATELAVAIEKPGNDIDPGQLRTVEDVQGLQADEKYPDITAMWRKNGDWGHLQASGILRSIGFETLGNTNNNPKGRQTGYGLDLTSAINTGNKNKLMLGAVYGKGIASYMNDGGTDLAPGGTDSDPHATLIPLLGLEAYYDHYWNEKFSSSIGYSSTQVDNSSLQEGDAFHKGQYASANLLYYPTKNVMMGVEGLWGSREDKDGGFGDDIRTQVSFKYNFSSLD